MKFKPDIEFGNRLRELRKASGLSQEKLCVRLQNEEEDISRSLYSKFETAERNIPISVIRTLKRIYGCEFNDFFIKDPTDTK